MSMERRGLSYEKRKGRSYERRVAAVNAVYDRWARFGLSNREIWRRYVWPRWGVSERTFYNMLYAPAKPGLVTKATALKEGWLWPEEGSPNAPRPNAPRPPEGGGGGRSQETGVGSQGGAMPLEFFRKVDG